MILKPDQGGIKKKNESLGSFLFVQTSQMKH